MTVRPLALLSTLAMIASITACGGGGGGGSIPGGGATPTPIGGSTPTPIGGSTPSPVATSTPPPNDSCASVSQKVAGLRRAPRASGALVPNRLYVTYKSGVRTAAGVEKNASVVRTVDLTGRSGPTAKAITLASGVDPVAFAATLSRDAAVQSVSRLHYRGMLSDNVANDSYLDNVDQWYLYKTNVDPTAWSYTHGRTGVDVAVIDTGVDETNPDFVFDWRESDVNGIQATGAGSVQDTNGHGTSTAGFAVAQTNNTYGFAGVGYSTHLMAFKIFPNATSSSDCQTADTADEATAVNDAVAHGASVISLSLGSPQSQGSDTAEEAAIEAAITAGVVVVAAAGNECVPSGYPAGPVASCPDSDGDQADFPAAYPGVIAAGASAVGTHTANNYASIQSEYVASYSNSGATLVAPGGDPGNDQGSDALLWIEGYDTTTAAYQPDQCTNSGGVCRALWAGTSMSTPQVAGAVALMEAYHGGARSLTPAQVTSILTSTADNIGASSTRAGAGRLDTGAAVAAAHP